jgi:hypothetical protein
LPVAIRRVSVQSAGLITLTLSSSELSTNTGEEMPAGAGFPAAADLEVLWDRAVEAEHSAVKNRVPSAHRRLARIRGKTFTKNLSVGNRLV